MIFPIIASLSLCAWAIFDEKYGEIPLYAMVIPCIIMSIFNLQFLFFMLIIIMMFFLIRKITNKIGEADIIAIPFTLFFMTYLNSLSLLAFPITIILLYLIRGRPKKIRFIPYLFLGFSVSLAIHLVLHLLFPTFFLY